MQTLGSIPKHGIYHVRLLGDADARWNGSLPQSRESGSSPEHGISLCMVEKRRVEDGLREFPFRAVGLFIVLRSPISNRGL